MRALIITMIAAFTQGQDSQALYWVTLILISIPILWLISKWERTGNLDDARVHLNDGITLHAFYDVETLIELQNRRKEAAVKKIIEQREDTPEERKEKSERRSSMVR